MATTPLKRGKTIEIQANNPKLKKSVQTTLAGKRLRVDEEQRWYNDGKPKPKNKREEEAATKPPEIDSKHNSRAAPSL